MCLRCGRKKIIYINYSLNALLSTITKLRISCFPRQLSSDANAVLKNTWILLCVALFALPEFHCILKRFAAL